MCLIKEWVSVMVRNYNGEVLACLNAFKYFSSQPILAECMALWHTMEFCEELGIFNVHLEGDARHIVDAIIVEKECRAWYGGIVEDVKAVLQQKTNLSIHLVYREDYRVAHSLVKTGLSLGGQSRDGGLPSFYCQCSPW